ncbi:MAG: aldehyde ferredoxin oxidoreductase family protein [Lachnospiraceae bacterium]|nr:aldehyde ferredoxin oxidoreductase family protein [Lachnospiraceae bacterium]
MSGLKGYMGKVLKIDLTSRTSGLFPWSDEDRRRTIGGKIMAADILFQHIRPGMKAFDEDNWIVITTGPLTGSGCPNTSRFNISTISPLTGIITSSNCGGNFGLSLKRAGYDACIITGRAQTPTTVHITETAVTFEDASPIWGLRISESQEKLPKDTDKLVIGPAGEHKVLYSCVFSGERTSGRGGVGAVFGDKNLKAVTAKGTKTCEIAKPEKLKAFNKKWVKTLKTHPLTGRQLPKLGTAGLIAPMQAHGILATRNFGAGRFDGFEKVSGEELAEKHLVSNAACTTCVIRCARMVKVDGETVKGPELETLGLLGPNILNDNIEMILRWNRELDELGMDTISAAGSIAFAMELNEKGMWDCGLSFGKNDNISETFRKIAFREGLGDDLANGTKRMSEKFGGQEFAIHAKGMELAAYEPRRAVGQGIGYATANRGGCHLNAGYMVVVEGLGLDVNSLTPHGKAALTIMFQNLMEAISACGSCLFTSYAVFPAFLVEKPNWLVTKAILKIFPYVGPVVNLLNKFTKAVKLNIPLIQHTYALNYVCNFKATMGTALTAGAHGYNTERMANVILGQKAGADALPKRLTDVPQDPSDPRTKVPLDKLKKDYYKARGWKDGIPEYKTLKRFGVDLYPKYYEDIVKEANRNG